MFWGLFNYWGGYFFLSLYCLRMWSIDWLTDKDRVLFMVRDTSFIKRFIRVWAAGVIAVSSSKKSS